VMNKVVHCKKEAFDVYIGRPSKWGNPFVIGKDGDRSEVVKKYKTWLMKQPHLLNSIWEELNGKTLGCFCSPEACHGDVLVEILDRMNNPEPFKDFRIGFSSIKNKYYVQNKKTAQFILENGKIGEYRDIGEGITGWYDTEKKASEILDSYVGTFHYCEFCGKFLGIRRTYDEIVCPGERAGRSMGDYYSRRNHYEDEHRMGTDDARGWSL